MGKNAPDPPPSPDPTTIAAAQTASNKDTAQYQSVLNNTNVNGPYGSVGYTQAPSGQWTQTTTLSPAEQAIFNQQTQAEGGALGIANTQLGRVSDALGQTPTQNPLTSSVTGGPIANSYATAGPIQGQVNTPSTQQAVTDATNASYKAATNLLDPQWDQATEHNDAALVAQGLNPNDAAYQNAMTIFNNSKNEAYDQAANTAVQTGQNEQNTLYGQALQSGTFANAAQAQADTQNQSHASFDNTAQQQGFEQASANANLNNSASQQKFQNDAYSQQLPINELTALLSSGQVTAPQSTPAQTSVAPTDVTGAYALQQQANQSAYQAQLQNYQSGLGGLFSLGSAAMFA